MVEAMITARGFASRSMEYAMTEFLTYAPAPALAPEATHGETPNVIALPQPDLRSGVPLMAALSLRASCREFAPTALPPATLGELLWAADGVNRAISGDRTAPSPHGVNEIDIYVAQPGQHLYDRLFL